VILVCPLYDPNPPGNAQLHGEAQGVVTVHWKVLALYVDTQVLVLQGLDDALGLALGDVLELGLALALGDVLELGLALALGLGLVVQLLLI